MKLIHTADLHIGKVVYGISLLSDQKYILNQIEKIIEKEQAEGLIIAGDIYDRTIPSAEAVSVMDDFLTNLIDKGKKIFIISGNHDSPERISFARRILEKKGLYIVGNYEKEVKKITLTDRYGNINFYLLPFAKTSVINYINGEKRNSYSDSIKKIIEGIKISTSERNILIAHCFVTNGNISPKFSGSETAFSVGGIDNVEADNFLKFDYVALGHIHSSQKINKEYIRYAGSPLKYSFSETFHKKSVVVIELLEKGIIELKEQVVTPLHDMRRIKGTLSNLLKQEIVNSANRMDYIEAILTDTKALIEPMGKLRIVYPNIMHMEIDKKDTKEINSQTILMKEKTMLEICKSFFYDMTGEKLEEKKEKILEEFIEKAEKGETDNEVNLSNR